MSTTFNGISKDTLPTPAKIRNSIASGLDYVGYLPGIGSVTGVARLIIGITFKIIYSIKAVHTALDSDKK